MVEGGGVKLESIFFRIGEFNIENLSFTIHKGEYFVLSGPNGAGKTIITKLIAGLLQPRTGTISIDGESVIDLPPWKRNIGYVPQEGILFPNRTVRNNISFGLEVRGLGKCTIRMEVERVAAMLGINHLLDRRVQGLSGGESQKVSLARALAFKPSLLLLDEPLSAIDEETLECLSQELRNLQRKTSITTLHIAHNQKEIDLIADRVGVLANGNLKEIRELRK